MDIMDKMILYATDHYLTIIIIIGAIAVVASVLKVLFSKTCPDCLNRSVPKQAKVCQKCGYRFDD